MWFPMLGHRCRSQNLTFSGKTKWFTEQISPENSYVPKSTISLKNVTKCHEISHFRCTDIWSPPRRFYAATTHMFLQQDLKALERLTWRLPNINFSENSFPQMDLGQLQFWSDEMARNLGPDDPRPISSGSPSFSDHLIRPKLKLT